MRLGLISDTHSPALGVHPPEEVRRAFAGVDLILHAGDIYSSECLDWLEEIAPVVAVEVPPAPVIGDPRVVEKRVVEVDGFEIGLVHDLAMRGIDEVRPGAMERSWPAGMSVVDSLAAFFDGRRLDGVVFGHTHWEMAETHEGVLFVNPGSPTLPHQTRRLGTVAIIDVTPEGLRGEVVDLAHFS